MFDNCWYLFFLLVGSHAGGGEEEHLSHPFEAQASAPEGVVPSTLVFPHHMFVDVLGCLQVLGALRVVHFVIEVHQTPRPNNSIDSVKQNRVVGYRSIHACQALPLRMASHSVFFQDQHLHAEVRLQLLIGCSFHCERLSVCFMIPQLLPSVANTKRSEV